MNTCERCGGEVSPGARFCRQCGAPVSESTEPMLPQTQRYGHQVERRYPPPEPEPPAWTYPGVGSSTSPFERQAAAQPYAVPQPRGSSTKFWITVVLLSCLLLMGITSAAFWAQNDRRARAQERRIAAELEETLKEQKAQAEELQKEAARAAQGAAAPIIAVPPIPPHPPNAPHPPTGNPELDRLIYPEGKLTTHLVDENNSVVKMTTSDSLEAVREFYEAQLPNSTILSKGNTVKFVKNRTVVNLNKPRAESPTRIEIAIAGK